MTRQSLPRGDADSGLDSLTLQSDMRIAALVAARRAAAVAARNRTPQPMVSRNPVADVLALYSADLGAQAGWASAPPRPPSPLFAITANLVASVRQAAEQRRRIPGASAQARAADTVAARISPAEARLLQLLGGSGRVDRHGIRHFDNPALAPDADATPPNGPGTPDGPAPASSTAAAASPPVPAPAPPPPPLSFSADDGWQYGHGWVPMAYREDASGPHWKWALPGALRDMLAGVEDIAQQRVTPEGTLTPNAFGALMTLPFAGTAPEGSLAAGGARRSRSALDRPQAARVDPMGTADPPAIAPPAGAPAGNATGAGASVAPPAPPLLPSPPAAAPSALPSDSATAPQPLPNANAPSPTPMVFRPFLGATPDQTAEFRAYVDASNEAWRAGKLWPNGPVSTQGALGKAAKKAAGAERRRAVSAGTPYNGEAGHAPDTTWTNDPIPHKWIDMSRSVNGSLGAQVRRWSHPYPPDGFELGEPEP